MHTPNLLVAYSSPGTFLPRDPDVAGPMALSWWPAGLPSGSLSAVAGTPSPRSDRVKATKRRDGFFDWKGYPRENDR